MEVDERQTDRSVLRFLKTGEVGDIHADELTQACSRYVRRMTQSSIGRAIGLAAKFVNHARYVNRSMQQTAFRAQGWCLLIGGRYHDAATAYLEARKLVAREPAWRGRIDRILVDVYMYLGDYTEARRRARLSLTTFQRARMATEAAKTRVNLANVLHRQDRHVDALREYEKASRFFEKTDDTLTLALCRYNHANTLVQMFDLDAAADLYKRSEQAFAELGYDLYANECRYGLSWLFMLQGDYYHALTGLAECEQAYRSAGQPRGVLLCTVDRAEAYLGLNLLTDAAEAARSAEQQARKLGFRYEGGKAALFLAKASYASGETTIARKAASRAKDKFDAEDNRAFLGVTALTRALAESDRKTDTEELLKARASLTSAQLPLWEAVCDLQLAWKNPEDRGPLARLRRNRAVPAVPHLYAQWQTLLGDKAAKKGRVAQAEKHWLQGAEMLDSVRAKLPPLELRTAFLQGRGDPYLRLIRVYSESDPSRAAAWSERYRTIGVWAPLDNELESSAGRRRAESSLAELAARVTALSAHISGTMGERGTQAPASRRAWMDLISRVRYDIAATEQGGAPASIDSLMSDFARVSQRLPVVQFHCDGDDLIAFVQSKGQTFARLYPSGRSRLRQFLGLWHILLGRSMLSRDRTVARDLADEKKLLQQLGDWIWSPLELDRDHKRVLIQPEGRLANLPWSALIVDREYLSDRHTILQSPSLRHFLRARRVRVTSPRVHLFVGSQEGLRHSASEMEPFTSQPESELEIHDPCRRVDWPSNQSARLWHFTGHAELRTDNPFYSSLQTEDGPMFAADFRLKRNRVGLVTLAACRTGQQMYLPGEEATGMVRSLLEMGAKRVIASPWGVADKSTAYWMREFYRCYLSDLPIGEAMQWSMAAVREKHPSAYHWAAFSLYGAI